MSVVCIINQQLATALAKFLLMLSSLVKKSFESNASPAGVAQEQVLQ